MFHLYLGQTCFVQHQNIQPDVVSVTIAFESNQSCLAMEFFLQQSMTNHSKSRGICKERYHADKNSKRSHNVRRHAREQRLSKSKEAELQFVVSVMGRWHECPGEAYPNWIHIGTDNTWQLLQFSVASRSISCNQWDSFAWWILPQSWEPSLSHFAVLEIYSRGKSRGKRCCWGDAHKTCARCTRSARRARASAPSAWSAAERRCRRRPAGGASCSPRPAPSG